MILEIETILVTNTEENGRYYPLTVCDGGTVSAQKSDDTLYQVTTPGAADIEILQDGNIWTAATIGPWGRTFKAAIARMRDHDNVYFGAAPLDPQDYGGNALPVGSVLIVRFAPQGAQAQYPYKMTLFVAPLVGATQEVGHSND